MDYNDHTTNNLKGKHLTYGERVKIEIWLEEGHNPSWIAKKLGRAKGTIYAVLVKTIHVTTDIHTSIFGVLGYTVLLGIMMLKSGTIAKSIMNAH